MPGPVPHSQMAPTGKLPGNGEAGNGKRRRKLRCGQWSQSVDLAGWLDAWTGRERQHTRGWSTGIGRRRAQKQPEAIRREQPEGAHQSGFGRQPVNLAGTTQIERRAACCIQQKQQKTERSGNVAPLVDGTFPGGRGIGGGAHEGARGEHCGKKELCQSQQQHQQMQWGHQGIDGGGGGRGTTAEHEQ